MQVCARGGADRRGVESQLARGVQCTRRREEIAPLLLGNGERCGEPFGERPRGTTFVGLDLSDCETRATDPLGERLLGKVQRFAPPPQPIAKRIGPLLHAVCPPLLRRV